LSSTDRPAPPTRAPGLEIRNSEFRNDSGFRNDADVTELSVGQLVSQMTSDASKLFKAELDLAKAELKEEIQTAGRGAGMLTGAGVGALYALGFLSLALMFGLGTVMGLGWAALIVTAIWAVAAAILAATGRSAMKQVKPGIPETVESVKEDARWVKRARG
jgi:hypothetical protein